MSKVLLRLESIIHSIEDVVRFDLPRIKSVVVSISQQ